jgi:hypothetical protein
VVHPFPWLLILGLPLGIHRLLVKTPTPPWIWFFGAMATALGGMTALGFVIAHRVRKRIALKLAARDAGSGHVV